MAATVGGQIRARVSALFSGRMYLDEAPDGSAMPYSTFFGPLSNVPALRGDTAGISRTELWQVDVWQKPEQESRALVDEVVSRLDGHRIQAGKHLTVTQSVRQRERRASGATVIHDAITVSVPRLV